MVALSGGVDSAVTALLLRRQGHDVEALFMHNWEEDDQGYCTSAQDFQDARRVADELGIALHRVDLSREYRERVFTDFLSAYRAGLTPNPDVLCNREIKFGDCLTHAQRLGATYLATGHYARLLAGPDGPELHKGVDESKDQSYFLHAVPRARLASALMPLGDLRKSQVRELARTAGLPVADKRDSTGICFIGERPFRQFLEHYIGHTPGPILDDAGAEVGTHIGLPFYTLGQRGGIGIGGLRGARPEPWYVVAKDQRRNALVVAQGEDHPALFCRQVHAGPINWLGHPPEASREIAVRLRYRQADQAARITATDDACALIETAIPQRAVTPGQSAVLYSHSRCLGGGVITRTVV